MPSSVNVSSSYRGKHGNAVPVREHHFNIGFLNQRVKMPSLFLESSTHVKKRNFVYRYHGNPRLAYMLNSGGSIYEKSHIITGIGNDKQTYQTF